MFSPRHRPAWLLPVLLVLALTLPHLDQGDWDGDTGRYAAVSLHMWRSGDWLVPHLQPAVAYYNKPPLPFWINAPLLGLFGPALWPVHLASVIALALAVGLTVGVIRRVSGPRVAELAGLVLASTHEFIRHTREFSLDLWMLVFLLAAARLVAEALRRRSGVPWLMAAGLPLGAALLCKPLVGLMAIPVFAGWMIRARRPRLGAALTATLLVAAAVAGTWYGLMHLRCGPDFLTHHFGTEVADRARGLINHKGPGFYLAELGRTYWPWMLPFTAATVLFARRRLAPRHRRAAAFALTWTAVWLVALSIFPDKRPRYDLPLFPFMAWMAALALRRWRAPRFLRNWSRRRYPGLAAAAVAAALLVAVLPVRVQKPVPAEWTAFYAWLAEQRVEKLWQGDLSTNDAGRLYLVTGRWPEPMTDQRGRPLGPLPGRGELIVYHRGYPLSPGRGETVVFENDLLQVSRLDADLWRPRRAPSAHSR